MSTKPSDRFVNPDTIVAARDLMRVTPPPKESWWVQPDREAFMEQAKAQDARFRGAAVEGREP